MNCDFRQVENIILAYPKSFRNDFKKATPVIEELISKIPKDINVQLIMSNEKDLDSLFETIGDDRVIQPLLLKDWDEIWLRDCMGFINDNKLIKPIYFPMYCDYRFRWKYFKKINELSKDVINALVKKEIIDIPLIWDGGNLINNDRYGLMTSKIVEDNPSFSRFYIEQMIKDNLGIEPIIIERQKEDVIGHIDGYASFISNNKLGISIYPNMPFLKDDNMYLDSISTKAAQIGLDTFRVYDRPVDQSIRCECKKKKRSGCFSVSSGIYVNNIILNDTVILPQYTLPTRKETDFYNKVNKEKYEQGGVKVETVNCDVLSQFGGSLHCLSFVY
ncbi:agmatine deiminase family protein [Sphingobacterium sp. FBM7-1]|uniref:agmatine deiminase family protein n=1 Tax=Sphingobacterium sp. FBM7-1 TaxID=2886688 RepID=UPI001D10D83F|nr:agmatine deiminase family protein [Sphingobacterium sp. FBM7-1]MCC2599785.1 agmatine deiminase family protein [Sphingobacterium sp. FBM7-1]